jgi:hypothetical protein
MDFWPRYANMVLFLLSGLLMGVGLVNLFRESRFKLAVALSAAGLLLGVLAVTTLPRS